MRTIIVCIFLIFVSIVSSVGQVPNVLSYQGRLTDGQGVPVPDGPKSVTFRIFDHPTEGTLFWQETNTVNTNNGYFAVVLGNITPINPGVVPFDRAYWMETQIGSDPPLAPRVQFTAAPYAFRAIVAEDAAKLGGKTASEYIDTSSTPQTKSGNLTIGGGLQIAGYLRGTFPEPAYDSGWQTVTQNFAKVLTHNLGGNPDDYVVDMWFKNASNGSINHKYYGGESYYEYDTRAVWRWGGMWYDLTSTTITVFRMANATDAALIRVRIWVIKH